jgi:protein subunit release factor A
MGFYCVPVFRPTAENLSMKTDDPKDRRTGGSTARAGVTFDPEKLHKQVIVEPYRSRGPGGQRKNKKETAIRLTHVPTGIVVIATESRSQAANREVALERLRKKLKDLGRPRKRRLATRPPAGAVRAQHEQKKRVSRRKKLRSKPAPLAELD